MHTPPSIPACERCNMRLAPHLTVRRKRDLFGDVRIKGEGTLRNIFPFFFNIHPPLSLPASSPSAKTPSDTLGVPPLLTPPHHPPSTFADSGSALE